MIMEQPVNVLNALANATQTLERAGIPSARLDAVLLMAHALRLTREQVLFSGEKQLHDNEIAYFSSLIARRGAYEPVAYITGKKEFWSLDFSVTRDTLIPRPDSETLVEAALKRMRSENTRTRAKPITILDIGTGTGCLLIALLKEIEAAQGIGVDNSEDALQIAKENAKRHGVDIRAKFIQSHWCDSIDGTFDLILSNPPYIAEGDMAALMPDVLRFEPRSALVAGADGLDAYRALSTQVALRLNPGGYACFEVGRGQAGHVSDLLAAQGLQGEPPEKDLSGAARCVVARKTPNVKDA